MLLILLKFIKNFLKFFSIISLIFTQFVFGYCSSALALELPITVDGSTNTQIDQSLNQIPVVNIAPVNSSGLSHNKFSDYNVNNSGLILNNASGNPNGIVLTKIGGIINDNPNLKIQVQLQ